MVAICADPMGGGEIGTHVNALYGLYKFLPL